MKMRSEDKKLLRGEVRSRDIRGGERETVKRGRGNVLPGEADRNYEAWDTGPTAATTTNTHTHTHSAF